jgi:two-component system sensor histidine kinase KdpD
VTPLLIWFVVGALAGAAVVLLWRRHPAPSRRPVDPHAARADLISKVAHELKNPIMAVKGLAATGSRLYESLSDEERRDLFRLIDAEAGRLKLIGDETSTTLKIDAGTLTYDARREDVGRLVEETAWRTPVGDHPMTVSAEAGLTAKVDRTRLAEVVSNLVDNAAKFSPADAPISIRVAGSEGGVLIDVLDGGPGIPDDRKGVVFERYVAWRPAGFEEVPGAGLGLYISRAHVTAHNGRLDIVDAEPRGTILRVWLPAGG